MDEARVVSQDVIDRYADVSGDRNPVHVDPTFASTTPFGTTIAHGLLISAYLVAEIDRSSGRTEPAPFVPFEVELIFVLPVAAGDHVHISPGQREGRSEEEHHELVATVGDRTAVVARWAPLAEEVAWTEIR